jgi:hypothetical protein
MELFEIPKNFAKVSRREGMKMLAHRGKILFYANISA